MVTDCLIYYWKIKFENLIVFVIWVLERGERQREKEKGRERDSEERERRERERGVRFSFF